MCQDMVEDMELVDLVELEVIPCTKGPCSESVFRVWPRGFLALPSLLAPAKQNSALGTADVEQLLCSLLAARSWRDESHCTDNQKTTYSHTLQSQSSNLGFSVRVQIIPLIVQKALNGRLHPN